MPETPRRAKIVCTLGPATRDPKTLRRLVEAGMDVARLNFSHGDAEEHAEACARVRRAAEQTGRPVAVLQDLQGPKLRVGSLAKEPVSLEPGGRVTLSVRKNPGPGRIPVTYRKLPQDVETGDPVLLDDGLLRLRVLRTTEHEVMCEVEEGGLLHSRKGMNLPGRRLSVPSLTTKDRNDLKAGVAMGVDLVALSFVRRAEDVQALRRALRRLGGSQPVIAKLEKPQAVENLEAIVAEANGIMVARGDLGVELSPELVPVLQKRMIRLARERGRPVITATQMLESMVDNSRPTRAEASDVANAVLDGTDALMLSAETAVGSYPVETVRMMDRIIRTAETSEEYAPIPVAHAGHDPDHRIADAIGEAATHTAQELGAKAIAVFTQSGATARVVAKHRPRVPLFAFTPDPVVRRTLSAVWGVDPMLLEPLDDIDAMIDHVDARLLRRRDIGKGDLVVILAGSPLHVPGTTNFLLCHRVGR
jgi:pyruvate kinase